MQQGVRTVKSFKLISTSFVKEGHVVRYPLIDGIIINQEDSHRSWILEMFIDKKHKAAFDALLESGELLDTKAVISYPENEPAAFKVAVYAVKEIGDSISVLMKGTLKRIRSQYAEQLLEELIDQGLEGEALIGRFTRDMKNRPQLRRDRDARPAE